MKLQPLLFKPFTMHTPTHFYNWSALYIETITYHVLWNEWLVQLYFCLLWQALMMHFVTKPTISTSTRKINLKVVPFVQLVNIQLHFTLVASWVHTYILLTKQYLKTRWSGLYVCMYMYIHMYVCKCVIFVVGTSQMPSYWTGESSKGVSVDHKELLWKGNVW